MQQKDYAMKRLLIFGLLLLVPPAAIRAQEATLTNELATQFHAGAVIGYNNGGSVQANLTVADFAAGFPLQARLGVGYTRVEPGSAAEARAIFINDATNGTPEKQGHVWDGRLDFLYPFGLFNLERLFLLAGPRYAQFTGNFKYVGGNEDFDVRSNSWGLGFGLEGHFPVRGRTSLVITTGYDYYPSATLSGHDTSYSPDGDDVNPRRTFTYADADKAIDQPTHVVRVMFGLSFGL